MHGNHRIHAKYSPAKLSPVNIPCLSLRRFDSKYDGGLCFLQAITHQ